MAVIIRLTLREAARRKVLWGLLILSGIFLALYALGWIFVRQGILEYGPPPSRAGDLKVFYNFLMMAGLYTANFLIVMLAVLISVDTLAGEIGSGTIQSIAVKPMSRRAILLGKWLGFAILLGLCTLLLAGGVMLITLIVSGYVPPNPFSGTVLMYVEALLFLSATFLGGTRLSTLANGVLGFGLFGLAFIGGFIEQIGGFAQQMGLNSSDTATQIGKITSLLMPSQALWRRALADMAEGLNPIRVMTVGATTPDNGILLYAAVYIAVLLSIAMWSFQRRDL
ncbi:MAG: ABC transporter permease [Anaerolineae bacterium]